MLMLRHLRFFAFAATDFATHAIFDYADAVFDCQTLRCRYAPALFSSLSPSPSPAPRRHAAIFLLPLLPPELRADAATPALRHICCHATPRRHAADA